MWRQEIWEVCECVEEENECDAEWENSEKWKYVIWRNMSFRCMKWY